MRVVRIKIVFITLGRSHKCGRDNPLMKHIDWFYFYHYFTINIGLWVIDGPFVLARSSSLFHLSGW